MIPVYTPYDGNKWGFDGAFYDGIESMVRATRKDLRCKHTLTEEDIIPCYATLSMWSMTTAQIAEDLDEDVGFEDCGFGVHKSICKLLTFETEESLPPLNAILAVVLYAKWRLIYLDMIRTTCNSYESPRIKKIIFGPITGGMKKFGRGPSLLETTFSLPPSQFHSLQAKTTWLCNFVRQDSKAPTDSLSVYNAIENEAQQVLKEWVNLVSAHAEIKVNTSLVRNACKTALTFGPLCVTEMLVLLGYQIFRQIEDSVDVYHAERKALVGNPLAHHILL